MTRSTRRAMHVINPATGDTLVTYDTMAWEVVAERLAAAQAAFGSWRAVSLADRCALLGRLAALLRERRREYAELMAGEMGKPVTQGREELDKCARLCDFYAERAPALLASREIATEARRSYVCYRPLGAILAVMPWNFPFWQVLRFAAPALVAGNTCVLKHAANVPSSAVTIERVFLDAGFPEGVFGSLLVQNTMVSQIIASPAIAAVTLTGSVPSGRAVARVAGENLKKTVLELGGSDPYLILADADLDRAAAACAKSRLLNSGQSCIAAKRFIVERAVAAEFERRLVACMQAAVVGDPLRDETEVGPLAREDLRDELHDQVSRSVELGARVACGGEVPQRPGAWYPPTVLAEVRPGMPAFDEEVFGPVAAVIVADDADHAVRLANTTRFGLGGAVFTRDLELGRRIAEDQLEVGTAAVNDLVRSDPRLPFGGVKESGYGRELGEVGIYEFVNAKTVWLA